MYNVSPLPSYYLLEMIFSNFLVFLFHNSPNSELMPLCSWNSVSPDNHDCKNTINIFILSNNGGGWGSASEMKSLGDGGGGRMKTIIYLRDEKI